MRTITLNIGFTIRIIKSSRITDARTPQPKTRKGLPSFQIFLGDSNVHLREVSDHLDQRFKEKRNLKKFMWELLNTNIKILHKKYCYRTATILRDSYLSQLLGIFSLDCTLISEEEHNSHMVDVLPTCKCNRRRDSYHSSLWFIIMYPPGQQCDSRHATWQQPLRK